MKLGETDIDDTLLNDLFMSLLGSVVPWYADYANYIMRGLLVSDLNHYHKNRLLLYVKKYFWD